MAAKRKEDSEDEERLASWAREAAARKEKRKSPARKKR